MLKLYNTRTKHKDGFQPLDAKNVRMYVCGPTVYDLAHIGNARPVIVFDVLFRLLRHLYGADHVTYARNITDVDDKINERAASEGISIGELTGKTAAQFQADARALGCLPPTFEPRATAHIPEMIAMNEHLIERGHAYEAEGHVLFQVSSDPNYGELARRSLDEMRAGARVDVAPYKRDPMDFVLWKPSHGNEPRWPSPWGEGRPGWHLECSAMAEKYLGKVFDIHGGGIDLVFPHHENEVAQSTCAHGTDIMANIWMHNGHLQVEGEKMSKSLGNFVTIRELLTVSAGDVVRLAMLRTHYRQPQDWTMSNLQAAQMELLKWAEAVRNRAEASQETAPNRAEPDAKFLAALQDDLNTPGAIARLHELYSEADTQPHKLDVLAASARFIGIRNISNPFYFHPTVELKAFESMLQHSDTGPKLIQLRASLANGEAEEAQRLANELNNMGVVTEIHPDGFYAGTLTGAEFSARTNSLLQERLAARKAKDWEEADRIREKLTAMGIVIKDAKDPETGEIVTTWEVAR